MTEIKINTTELTKTDYQVPKEIPTFKLVPENDPILKEVLPLFDFAEPPVNPNQFASALVETCKENRGLGLSANQCGFKHRVFVMGSGDEFVAHFNPKLIEWNGESIHMMEGCLSFPLLGLMITRPSKIKVRYQDFNGETHENTYEGLSARVFLHELDHMDGIIFTSRAKPLALKTAMKKRNKVFKKFSRQFTFNTKQSKYRRDPTKMKQLLNL